MLTPVRRDPLSGVPLLVATARVLADPAAASTLAHAAAVRSYAVTPEAVDRVRTSRA
jgi:hypothetical protein